ncbi:SH3 domain-containing protein [Streptomyces sp. NPDC053048]|uniref:SH3 domain-containing protein n=1 Tax=Streptomyces sp. NPDC053048 TaxID=3365694 RepID=UPI0037CFB17A
MRIGKSLAVVATASLLGGGLLLAPSASAVPGASAKAAPAVEQLLSCSHGWSNKDSGSKKVTASGVRYRVGPHTSCDALGQIPQGATVYYHCYTRTQDDGTWSHVRIKGTERQGWVKDTLLGGGSLKLC